MTSRKRLGWSALGALLVIGLAARSIVGDEWPMLWTVVYVAAICYSFWLLRETPDKSRKMWNYSPRRGLLYFLLGFVIFPITAALSALFGDPMSLTAAALFTLGMSVTIGVVGTFTENVGV